MGAEPSRRRSDLLEALCEALKDEVYEVEPDAKRSPAELAYRKGWNDRTADLLRRFFP